MSESSYLSKAIAAGVTTALLSFGAHFGGSYLGTRGAAHKEYVNHLQSHSQPQESKPRYSSAYGEQLCSWLKDVGYENNGFLRSAFKSNMSDTDKHSLAMEFYNAVKDKKRASSAPADQKHDEHMYLESVDTPDGSYLLDKRKGHIVATLKKTSHGVKFSGNERHITFFGGRNEWGGIADRMYNGVYHDKE